MKQLIIICMLTILGIYLYHMILGEQEGSIRSHASQIMVYQLNNQKIEP